MGDLRPNVILITLHDLGRQLQVYDPDLPPTPHIQRIADRGVTFLNHFATCPLCSPSRASIVTGRYPHANGMNGLTHRGFRLDDDEKVIADCFNDAGYHTALYGFQHEAEPGEVARLGFREVVQPEGKAHIAAVAPAAETFLMRRHTRPFFLAVGASEAHRKFKVPGNRPIPRDRVKVPPYLTDCREVREDLADFYGMVQTADAGVGAILNALAAADLEEDTILMFATDHGFAFPRAKSTLYDPGIGVALLMQWPGAVEPGALFEPLSSHVDILPTLLDAVGERAPERVQGQSLVARLLAEEGPERDCIFAEKSWHGNEYDPMRCIRNARYKYIRNFADGWLYQTPLDIKRGLAGKVMEPLRHRPRPAVELYDLFRDPDELTNVAGRPAYARIERDLDARLAKWMRDTGDPLPDRPIAWPQPGKEHYLNNMDCPMPEALE